MASSADGRDLCATSVAMASSYARLPGDAQVYVLQRGPGNRQPRQLRVVGACPLGQGLQDPGGLVGMHGELALEAGRLIPRAGRRLAAPQLSGKPEADH